MKRLSYLPALKRLVAGVLFAICAVSASAQVYYLNVFGNDGSRTRFEISKLDSVKLSYEQAPIEGLRHVDLGLSVEWASFNIGATNPYEPGDYFAWGETETKDEYNYNTYKFKHSSISYGYTKYNYYANVGPVDYKYRLDMEDDAARVIWGSDWRMPTKEEMEELVTECRWSWYEVDSVKGYMVTGPNGNHIFLPAGYFRFDNSDGAPEQVTSYLSSSLDAVDKCAWGLDFYDIYTYGYDRFEMSPESRYFGELIRPVYDWKAQDNVKPITKFDLKQKTVSLTVGEQYQLEFELDSAFLLKPSVGNNSDILQVTSSGLITALAPGTGVVTASLGEFAAECTVTVAANQIVSESVDLGLSVKWATCNLGAETPTQYGYYYSWGETEPKGRFGWGNYKWYNSDDDSFTKYTLNSENADNKAVLDPEDDAAQKLWGGEWRMPTSAEFDELGEKCDWVWTTENGVSGFRITSRVAGYTDQSIFLPAAGYSGGYDSDYLGYYWVSSLASKDDLYANFLYFNSDYDYYIAAWYRYQGRSIRPVLPFDTSDIDTVVINQTELSIVIGESHTLKLAGMTADGRTISISGGSWASDNEKVATVDQNGVVTAIAEGSCIITVSYGEETLSCTVDVYDPYKPEYVDLGLSVKWATFNLGAAGIADYGDYYAWGETDTYYSKKYMDDYSGLSFIWRSDKSEGYCAEMYSMFTMNDSAELGYTVDKYCTDKKYGVPDNRSILEMIDDVANVKWGDNWRIPSIAEFQELMKNCDVYWTNIEGVQGYVLYSKVPGYEDSCIFLPAAGSMNNKGCYSQNYYGYYWTNAIDKTYNNGASAYYISRDEHGIGGYWRSSGFSVRPVYPFEVSDIADITLNKEALALAINSNEELNIVLLNKSGNAISVSGSYEVVWASDDESVATVTDGNVKAIGAGTCTITVTYGDLVAECPVTVADPSQVEPEYVDLGLGVKWATFNVGAFTPEMLGDYYAWGEIEPYYESGYAQSTEPVWKSGKEKGYAWGSYRWAEFKDSVTGYYTTKYIDAGKMILEASDDIASQMWGNGWHTPTEEDFEELAANCYVELTDLNGVTGFQIFSKVKGYEENSIFIPLTGYRSVLRYLDGMSAYWTSTTNGKMSSYYASLYNDGEWYMGNSVVRYLGFPIRPVQYFDDSDIDDISLNYQETAIPIGKSIELLAKGVLPDREIVLSGTVNWSSSDEEVVTVVNGAVKAVGAGTATITAEYNGNTAECTVVVADPDQVEKEYVDLGLSVNWATFNVGAISPEHTGDYYAWGETEPKSSYYWNNYKYCEGSENTMTKYCLDEEYGFEGFTDGLTILEPVDDVAHVKWGGDWRMPTRKEYQDLVDNCTWTWTTFEGIAGYLVTSNVPGYEDSSIFLPAAGYYYENELGGVGKYGDYWSSYTESASSYEFFFSEEYHEPGPWSRFVGLPVRPVCKNKNYVDKVIITDNITVLVNEEVDGEMVYHAEPRIVADPADSTNQCIMVTTNSNPENYYDTQMFISVDSAKMLPGAELVLSFRYKADKYQDCSTEIHSKPGVWVSGFEGRDPYFTTSWQKYEISTRIEDPNQRTFVINLSDLEDGNNCYFDDIKVTITDIMNTGFYLDDHDLYLEVGSYHYLNLYDDDYNQLNSYAQWISTNDSVAIVNRWGEVYAVGEGSCYIVASFRDYKDSCEVFVSEIPVDEPYLSIYPRKLDMQVGEVYSLSFETNTGETVVWTSSDDSVATVDKYGVVTAVAEGHCTIAAIAGKLSAECGVVVMPEYNDTIDAKYDFMLSEDSLVASFYYYDSNFGYEMSAEFCESDSGVVCTSILYAITLSSAEEAQEAYANMTKGLTDSFIDSLDVVFNDEGTGFSYTYPKVIGMDREAVLAMMYQSYNSMVDPEIHEEPVVEEGYVGKVQPYLPAEYADSSAVAAWYLSVYEDNNRISLESVFLFEDGTLVATKSKFYSYKDGRDPEYRINGYGTYELTEGDYDNGVASVVLSDGTVFEAEIEEGVLSAMGSEYYKQKNEDAPQPMHTK